MPQSLSTVYLHLAFSTKDRISFLRDVEIRTELHSFIGAASRELDCAPIIVGGVEDHLHLLARFGRTVTQADWMKEVKRTSSVWIKERSPKLRNFAW